MPAPSPSIARPVLFAAGLHFAVLAAPTPAFAQGAQPVPYATAPAPVPYGTPPAAAPPQLAPTPGSAAAASAGRGAAAAGGDVIYMKNGGILRGTLIDAIPGAQARIELATGEIATVPWPDIGRIEHGEASRPSAPPPPPPAYRPGLPAAGAARPPPGGMVWVHLEGSDAARLEQDVTGQGDDWRVVCEAPCDRAVSNTADYRITGGGMKNSKVFRLRGQQGEREVVTVSAASKGWFVVGIVLVPVGGVVALVGLLFGLAGSFGASLDAQGSTAQTQANNTAAAGWTTALIGAAGLVVGIVLIASNARTSAAQDVGAAQTGLLQSDAWKRVATPSWKEAGALDRALPPGVGMPVLSGRF